MKYDDDKLNSKVTLKLWTEAEAGIDEFLMEREQEEKDGRVISCDSSVFSFCCSLAQPSL